MVSSSMEPLSLLSVQEHLHGGGRILRRRGAFISFSCSPGEEHLSDLVEV
jgi:hypothetical protein